MNNIYIEATAQIDIIDRLGNIVDETDWNEDKHLLYHEFDDFYYSFEDIEYYDVLNFAIDEMSTILDNDDDLREDYPNCTYYLKNVNVYCVYNDDNKIYF